MAKKILLIDDSEDIRELVTFVANEVGDYCYVHAASVSEAKVALKSEPSIDLVICDFNLPDGEGPEVYEYFKDLGKAAPFLFLSGEQLSKHPLVKHASLPYLRKPFTGQELQKMILQLLGATAHKTNYIPVNLRLLQLIYQVKTPLYVKINESKYVQMTPNESVFDQEQVDRYQAKGLENLYIAQEDSESFISEYRKKTLSQMAWDEIDLAHIPERVMTHMDFLKKFSDQLGIREDVTQLAAENIQKVLDIAHQHPQLTPLLKMFTKIDRWGNSDHCSVLVVVCEAILDRMNLKNPVAHRSLAFASLVHDLTLTDDEYEHKRKNIKKLRAEPKSSNSELKRLRQHPAVASEICRTWDYCPQEAVRVIFEHHEQPDGTGFPMGRRGAEVHPLSALFIVAEDFTDHYMESFGSIDLKYYIGSRSDRFSEEPYLAPFSAFKAALQA